jgi:hypothetical protein
VEILGDKVVENYPSVVESSCGKLLAGVFHRNFPQDSPGFSTGIHRVFHRVFHRRKLR